MKKKTLRTTAAQSGRPIVAQPARDHAALVLPLSVIKLGDNVRSTLGDLTELIESIRAHGILQPLVVAKTGRGLELIAGFRRYHAAKGAGLVDVPVRVIGVNESQIVVLRLVENVVREDLSGHDEIMAVAKLSILFSDQVQLAAALGKSKTYVSRCLKAAKILKDGSCAGATRELSKSALFELADADQPVAVANELGAGTKLEARAAKNATSRGTAGPVLGGRYVGGAIQFRENEKTRAFSLRINFDPERTPVDTKVAVVKKLEEILKRLTSS